MGLDLKLFSISNKANFVLKKAKANIHYAMDFDKITDTETLELFLQMIQKHPDGTPEFILRELIEDSIKVINFYPDKNIQEYTFCSDTRGYATINYLLIEWMKSKCKMVTNEIFYSGVNIENKSQYSRFQYISHLQTKQISELLQSIDFNELIQFYDFRKMDGNIYKLTHPDNFKFLGEEFDNLKKFYLQSKKIDAFVVVKIS